MEAENETDVEKLAAIRYKAIVERVLTAPYRNCAVIEVSIPDFNENMKAQGKVVDWGVPDIFGFMSPTFRDLDSEDTEP